MQIQIKCSCGAEHCAEWAIVEVQGVLEIHPNFQDRLPNLLIGHLCRPSPKEETYTFTIGYHELTGSKVTLRNPLIVLKKVTAAHQEESPREFELDVIGIVRHKFLFKTRPRALVSTSK